MKRTPEEDLALAKLGFQAAESTGTQFNVDRVWLAKFAELVAARERAGCVQAIEDERVDAAATEAESDIAYNQAITDSVAAIYRRAAQ